MKVRGHLFVVSVWHLFLWFLFGFLKSSEGVVCFSFIFVHNYVIDNDAIFSSLHQQWYWLFVLPINNHVTMSFCTGLFSKRIVSKNNTFCRNLVLYSWSGLYIHDNSGYAYRYHSNTNKYVPYEILKTFFLFICTCIN